MSSSSTSGSVTNQQKRDWIKYQLQDLSAYDAGDIECGGIEIYSETEDGRECSCEVEIPLIAQQGLELIAELEQELIRLKAAADMLSKISVLVAGEGQTTSTTLEAATLLKHKVLQQDIYVWLALLALKFEAGDWGAEKQARHYEDQIKIALSYLDKATKPEIKHGLFTVSAGKYDDFYPDGENIKISRDHLLIDDALKAAIELASYPICRIDYKGKYRLQVTEI